jgi:hypothetical protein
MTKDQAMVYLINFFSYRLAAVNKFHVDRAKELIGLHEISASELVNKYVELVYENS